MLPPPGATAPPFKKLVARTWENSDRIAMSAETLAEALHRPRPRRGRHRTALTRTHLALQRTEAKLAQTAHSLQRTVGHLPPREAS